MSELSLQARFFDAWARAMLRHRIAVLITTGIITIALGGVAAMLPLMTTLTDFLPPDTPGMGEWLAAREAFGGDEVALIVVEADDHFTTTGLERLASATATLTAHPFTERVLTLADAQQMRTDPADSESLLIEAYLRDGHAPEDVRAAVLADPLFAGTLVSKDGRFIALIVQSVPNRDDVLERPGIADAVDARVGHLPGVDLQRGQPGFSRRMLEVAKGTLGAELVDRVESVGYSRDRIHAVGFTILMGHLLVDAQRNMQVLTPFTFFLLAAALFFLLRRPLDAILPLICVGPAVIWAIAAGGLIFGRITIITSVAPVMVLVVGVSDVVHLVTQFRHDCARGYPPKEAIVVAFRQVGSACALTSLTTFIGFGSMVLLPLPPSRELGVFAAFGVVAAFVTSFVLTPVLLSFTKPSSHAAQHRDTSDFLTNALVRLNDLIRPRPRIITAIGLVVTVAVVWGVFNVPVENALTRKLRKGHPVRESVQTVEAHLGASAEIELLIDAGAPRGLEDPVVVAGVAKLLQETEAIEGVTDTSSIIDLLSRMNELLTGSAGVPATGEGIAQYLLLFEMSGGEDLDTLIDQEARIARVVVRLEDMTAEEVVDIADRLDVLAQEILPKQASAVTTGIGTMSARLGPRLLTTSLEGFGAALGLIAVLLALLFRSARVGLLSLIPNLMPVGLGLLASALFFEQIDADSLTFLAISIGIAVDDTIHFLARYRIERSSGAEREEAVRNTMVEAGHGITRTSLVLVAGFAVFIFGDYQPIATMGVMLCVTLASAVLLDLTLVPAMAQLGLLEPRIDSSS